ncbi:MAG: phosphomannomutase/phosphoglucomutase [Deltaproteobacteria bacterium]|nr:phosphomannomutase/phosphoglucomutase [Deltaproteobacteria bacterium]
MSIFKAYDIRGIVGEELGPEDAYAIGRATVRYLAAPALLVGRDARPSSPDLLEALVRGILDEGADVLDAGLASTPMVYFGVDSTRVAGGVSLTASHNPARYNGFKLCREHAIPIGAATGLREIEAIARTASGDSPAVRRGTRRSVDLAEGYADHLLRIATAPCPKLRVAIDCGNGMASVGLEPLLARLPLTVERLYFEPDGSFPNHEADPLKEENLRDVADAVKRTHADLGVAFDGDADRAVFVDETGRPVSSDLMTALLAAPRLRRHPGGRVLYDLRSSRATREAIEAAGGVAEMCRVGHSFVKAAMRESGAIFGGELSGHFYFRFSDTLVADDGCAAFVALLDVLAVEKRPLSELVAPLRRYHATGEVNRRVKDVDALLRAIEAEHASAPAISHMDGLRVEYSEWWFSLRPSNTEPVLRLNLEATTHERMVRERDRLLARIEAAA